MSTQLTDSVRKAPSNTLNHQVAQYSLAAAVAGVGMLALLQPAAGEVVVTKKTIHIPLAPRNMQEPVKVSMANNGVDNFSFILSSSATSSFPDRGLRELLVAGIDAGQGKGPNQFLAGGDFYAKALALARGANIGPAGITSATFASFAGLVEGTNSSQGGFYSRGYWAGNLKNRYIGVRFQINGQFHYGWIRLTATTNTKLKKPSLEATITGYAYETVPNKPIKAGTAATAASTAAGTAEKPTTEIQVPKNIQNQSGPALGMLALGSQALALWRREDTLISN
jgi:hypothetical protein